ncbi:XrtA-associated tyrosine autokinase [Desulfuromonas thiophila]|uniref:XrtA-associated tyrosine autokinase n=1 Tax=Desulfuromonas thiophila TaxID=57664 RepID=UPI0024A9B28D|nr:XrtA-associated tyrosine autokinase [Desulfuromonas thiophila]
MSRLEKAMEMAARQRQTLAVDAVPMAVENDPNEPVAEASQEPSAPQPVAVSSAAESDAIDELFASVPQPLIENPFLVTASDESGPAAEQYRKLKSAIVKFAQLGRFDKSLMVTSAIGGEGKTLTSLNLAITLAQEFDHTVLLVEADIRRPTIMQYLHMEASVGLTDCVLDGLDVGQALVKTGIGKLTVLPAGRRVPNPVELFSSNRMQELLDELKSRYPDRYVIVDTTPILPFAEPQYIASGVGGVLFVVREGYTALDKVNKALALLKNHNLLGVVCNGVSLIHGSGATGYYGYYGYK